MSVDAPPAPAASHSPVPPEPDDRWARVRKRLMPSARTLWLLVLLAVVGYLVIIPVATVLWGSFKSTPAGVPGALTFDNYIEAFTSGSFGKAIRNSFIFATASSILAFILGCYLAWITERTNTPFRPFIYAFVLVPIIVPGILTTIAWVLVLNTNIGLANWALTFVGVEEPVFNSYTMYSMIWADATDSITLPFLLMAAAFRAMDPSLEEASTTAGASNGYTLRHVTLPLMTPAVLATFLIVFVKTIDSFEVPAVMGLPGGISVFATEVWLATSRFPSNHNLAAAYAVGYLGVTVLGLALYYKATSISEKFATITGKGYKPLRMDLGGRRYVHAFAALTILFISVLLPFLVMLYASVLPFYSLPNGDTFSRMSLENYRWVLDSPVVFRALKNNVVVGLGSAAVAMVLAALISWVVIRTKVRGRKLLDAVAFAPIAFPGIVLALALMWFYLTVPVPVYATLWIIGLAFVTAYLPYGLRATHASLSQVGRELEEASAACGATFRRTFVSIIMPLITSGLLVGFIYVFSRSFKGLSLPIMLAGPGTEVLSVLVFDLYDGGHYTRLNALGILMFVFLVIMSAISQRLAKKIGYVEVQ